MISVLKKYERLCIVGAGSLSFLAYCHIFLAFLPSPQNSLGHDYSYFVPQLMAGYFWFKNNGLTSIPWFTPAFFGGIPFYPNPQNLYLSVPQFLTFFWQPIKALQVTFIIFALLGMAGFYSLMRGVFLSSRWPALLGATLFLFNATYASRMIIGHLTYHSMMLAPLTAYFIMKDGYKGPLVNANVLWGSLCIAYMMQTGMVHTLPAVLLGTVVIIATYWLICSVRTRMAPRFLLALTIALCLCSSKIMASLSFLELFPRKMLPLSGYEEIWQVAWIALKSTFIAPASDLDYLWLKNNHWYPDYPVNLGRHELEYGVTLVPLFLMGLFLLERVMHLIKKGKKRTSPVASVNAGAEPRSRDSCRGHWPKILPGLIGIILLGPIFLNWYQPAWNQFLKKIPVISSSYTLSRYFFLYPYLAIFLTTLLVDRPRFDLTRRLTPGVVLVAILLIVYQNKAVDRSYYYNDKYFLDNTTQAYELVKAGRWQPTIDQVVGENYQQKSLSNQVDSLYGGGSQMYSYEPLFGHMLEKFPFGNLALGPMLAVNQKTGILNIKKPSCFIFPRENHCQPGDHYHLAEVEEARNFLKYQAIRFEMPLRQKIANYLSLGSVVLVFCALLWIRLCPWLAVPSAGGPNPRGHFPC